MKIISGTANEPLSQAIVDYLMETKGEKNLSLVKRDITRFPDEEIYVEISDNIRGEDVFLIQPTHSPANDHLMELLILLDALKRSSAQRITAVLPYYGYARQDRKTAPRTPITAKLVAKMIEAAGADRILTMDLHAGQIQGFFEIPTDNLFAMPRFGMELKDIHPDPSKIVVVSPDVGGVLRARNLAKRLECDLAIIDKRRPRAGLSEVMNIIGDVQGMTAILVDDICDSAGTLVNAAEALVEKGGASEVVAYISHGVFSPPAVERIFNSPLRQLVTTDSIQFTREVKNCQKIRQFSVAPLFGEAIHRIHSNESVSDLFA
ncbi:MAG: ribose-phosphate pyrophosphokinase [Alphaproteobacteria bacterium]|nr:ribose-phosphate pyrophosphokinase [Alphaproteobacteria bacterium]